MYHVQRIYGNIYGCVNFITNYVLADKVYREMLMKMTFSLMSIDFSDVT